MTGPEKRAISNISTRTKYLNELIASCAAAAPTHPHFESLLAACGCRAPITQVVLLGAGMDTRAWALELGQHLTWFELDQQRVLDAKLLAVGKSGGQTSGQVSGSFALPLKCGAYHAIGACWRCRGLGRVAGALSHPHAQAWICATPRGWSSYRRQG